MKLSVKNLFKLLFNKLKQFFSATETKYFCSQKTKYLKIRQSLLLEAINQTLQELNWFDYYKLKNKYGDELFYFLFEQLFRGKRQTIKERQKVYIEYAKDAYSSNKPKPWLDIGCGRGEFIELLHAEQIPYIGVDTNAVNIDLCLKRGLNVVKEDGLNYLRKLEDNSLCGVSAIQVVEHLSREQLVEFIKLCYEKVSPLGKIIIETVNIRNDIASKNYFLDYTHNLPLMPEFISMYLEFVGFKDVFVLYLTHSYNIVGEKHDIRLYPDYAVVGTK